MMVVYIAKVAETTVWVDDNHPLAGETLYFNVEIVNVREATDAEVASGQPHSVAGEACDTGCC